MKRWMKLLLILSTMLCASMALAAIVHADDLPSKEELERLPIQVYGKEGGAGEMYFPKGTSIKNISISNKVFKTSMRKDGDTVIFAVTTKKAAKAKLTFTAVCGKQKQSYVTNVRSVNYKNPFKLFQIGNKKYTALYDNADSPMNMNKAIKGKLTIKMNAGYKLVEMEIDNTKDWSRVKKVKNNSNITLKKGQALHLIYIRSEFPYDNFGFEPIIVE